MKKKYLFGVSALALCAAFSLFGACIKTGEGNGFESSSGSSVESNDSDSSANTGATSHRDLVSYFENAAGSVELTAKMNMVIGTNSTGADVLLGGEGTEQIVVDGSEIYSLTVQGAGGGVIQAANDGTLVFKNLLIKNTSGSYAMNQHRAGYADFGGKLRFENCEIEGAIQLQGDAQAEFIDCSITSPAQDMYAVWFSDGAASFKNCTFQGPRAIKLYEGSDDQTTLQEYYDVASLTLEGCKFRDITQKPGLAIDVFAEGETTIVIKNCHFNNCQPWKAGSYEGIDGVYESRIDTTLISFTMEDIWVNGIPCEYDERETSK